MVGVLPSMIPGIEVTGPTAVTPEDLPPDVDPAAIDKKVPSSVVESAEILALMTKMEALEANIEELMKEKQYHHFSTKDKNEDVAQIKGFNLRDVPRSIMKREASTRGCSYSRHICRRSTLSGTPSSRSCRSRKT